MGWIKGKSPGDNRWYLVYLPLSDGQRAIFPARADPTAKGMWAGEEFDQMRWEDFNELVTHYHKIEPWPDPPAEGE